MKIAILTYIFSLTVFAHQVFNPVQGLDRQDELESMTDGVVWTKQLKDEFALLRIKIFPHNSKYNSPHGKDNTTDSLLVASKGQCKMYRADQPTSEGGITRNEVLKTGNKFQLTVSSLRQAIWIECNEPIEVTRPDYVAKPISYNGVLFVKVVNNKYLTAVNVLPFEDYLKGVVPSEMPASWSIEALRAQAIAARTYAYYELGFNVSASDENLIIEESGAQIDDTVTYQAYMGLKNSATSTNRAIDETSGMVMTHNDKVIKAYFHADSGGHTENAENVWGVFHPYIIGKKELYPAGAIPGEAWSFVIATDEISNRLKAADLIAASDVLEKVEVVADDLFPSSRPKKVLLTLDGNKTKEISAVEFSFAMKIKSAWIEVSETTNQRYIIAGRGFGHGAGMNQWGARYLVDKLKMSYEEVLKFYYTDIIIQK